MTSNYTVRTDSYRNLVKKLELPRYQRKLVWSKTQKEEFIKSIKEGFPFGSLLLFKYEPKERFSLIDGLQRLSTLIHFEKEPYLYFEEDFIEVVNEIIEKFYNSKSESIKSEFRKELINIMNEVFSDNLSDVRTINLFEKIQANSKFFEMTSNDHMRYFINLGDNLKEKLKNSINLENLQIPIIEFNGSEDQLVEVFERINRGGVKLTKYQIFAAQWINFTINLNNSEYNKKLLNKVIDRYRILQETRGIEIEDYDEDKFRERSEINLSELCYGIGKLISDNSEVFITSDKDEDLAYELGFCIMGVISKVSNNELSKLSSKYKDITSDKIEKFCEQILKIFSDLEDEFKKYLKFNDLYISEFSNFQYISFFTSLWIEKYQEVNPYEFKEKPKYKSIYNSIKEKLPKWYLHDRLINFWGATGDKKLNDFYIEDNNRYLKDIDSSKLENALIDWNKESLEKKSEKISSLSKLVLVYYYNTKDMEIVNLNSKNIKYDFEHIISKKRIKEILERDPKFPGGNIGNICFLDIKTNRGKGNKTVYDDTNPVQKVDSKIIEDIGYPTESELKFMSNEHMDIIEYKRFVKIRSKDIITTLIKNLYSK